MRSNHVVLNPCGKHSVGGREVGKSTSNGPVRHHAGWGVIRGVDLTLKAGSGRGMHGHFIPPELVTCNVPAYASV